MPVIAAPPNDYDYYAVFVREPSDDTECFPDGHARIIGPFGTWEEADAAATIHANGSAPRSYVRWAPMRRPGPEDVPAVRLVHAVKPDHPAGAAPHGQQIIGPRIVRDDEYDIEKMRRAATALRDALGHNTLAIDVTLATMFEWAQVSDAFRRKVKQ